MARLGIVGAERGVRAHSRTDMGTYDAVRLDSVNWATYAPAELRSDLSGEWNVCTFVNTGVHIRSFRFTADGHWTVLFDDGDGGVTRSPVGSQAPIIPGYDAGAAGSREPTCFWDNDGQPPSGPRRGPRVLGEREQHEYLVVSPDLHDRDGGTCDGDDLQQLLPGHLRIRRTPNQRVTAFEQSGPLRRRRKVTPTSASVAPMPGGSSSDAHGGQNHKTRTMWEAPWGRATRPPATEASGDSHVFCSQNSCHDSAALRRALASCPQAAPAPLGAHAIGPVRAPISGSFERERLAVVRRHARHAHESVHAPEHTPRARCRASRGIERGSWRSDCETRGRRPRPSRSPSSLLPM